MVWPGHVVELTHVDILLLCVYTEWVGERGDQNLRGCFLTGGSISGVPWGSNRRLDFLGSSEERTPGMSWGRNWGPAWGWWGGRTYMPELQVS